MYIVTSYWRGSMHVDNMRGFDDEEKAKAYYFTIAKSARGERNVRAYQLSDNQQPKRMIWKKGTV